MDLIRILYPKRCPVCDNIIPDTPEHINRHICIRCNAKLHYIKPPKCMKCGKQLYSENEEYCMDCKKKRHEFTQGIGVFAYDKNIKKTMYRFKYSNRREYAEFFGDILAARYGHLIRNWQVEAVIPIPLYRIKYLKRGYNQAELIAKALSKQMKIPMDSKILIRSRKTRAMKELNDEERVKNLQNAFKLTENIVKYKKVLLVDDIYTTGATMDACAKVLKEGGIKEIYCASICIGNGF